MTKGIRAAMPRASSPKPAVEKPKSRAGRFKFCCPALEMACGRANDNQRSGIQTGSMLSTSGKRASWRTAVVIYFPKAKKGDESKYGFKSKFKDTSYGLCKFCPFCGTRLEAEEKPKVEAATPGPGGEVGPGQVAGDGAQPSPVQPGD